jgi:hypothetical protein
MGAEFRAASGFLFMSPEQVGDSEAMPDGALQWVLGTHWWTGVGAGLGLESCPQNPVTHSTYTPDGGERQRKLHEQWAGKCAGTFEQACAAKGLVWSGYFGCQGAPSKLIEIFIRRAAIKDPAEWPGYIAETKKHPDAEDEARARALAREVTERVR